MKSFYLHFINYLKISFFLIICTNGITAQFWETLADVPERLTFPVVAVVDGKIHAMGGGGTGGATAKHYQYDPLTNVWTSKADVPYKAQQPAGTANGNKIHFFGGGFPTSGAPVKNHYIYDATSDSWSKAADLSQARAIHYGVTLNGQVYTLAGQGVADWCEAYDESTNTWIRKNNLPDSKFWYGAHIVTHGSIFRFCGGGYTAPVNTANRYDPVSDSWTNLPAVPIAIHGVDGAAIGDKIYLVGGYHDFADSDEVWIYDINTKTYTKGVPLPVGRTYHNIVTIENCIYSIGGNNAIDPTIGVSLLRFCPEVNTSTENNIQSIKPVVVNHPDHLSIQFIQFDLNFWNLEFIDLNGKMIYSEKINSVSQNPYTISTTGFSNSYYSVRLYNTQTQYHYPYLICK